MIKDLKLTEIMLKALKRDPKLATQEEWEHAGDFAMELRFFPHAFNCYHNALDLNKTQEVAEKLNTVLDKITNVLEILPEDLKEDVEEFRLNNPLDPEKWLALSNKLLKAKSQYAEELDLAEYESARIALAICVYCTLRSGGDASPINHVLSQIVEEVDASEVQDFVSPQLEFSCDSIQKPGEDEIPVRIVAAGDQFTLGLQPGWELRFEEVYHFLWSKSIDKFMTLANCGISGAGALDALLFLKRDVLNYQPNIVFLNYGLNDAWLGHGALLAYEVLLEAVVKLIKPHAEVVLVSPIPHIPEACPEIDRPSDVDLKEVEIEAWINALKRVAIKTDTPLADATAVFPEDKEQRRAYLSNGFNQANLEGHKLILKALDEVVTLI